MQEGFLFDDNDPKQKGQGCDSLCTDDKRLKFKWRWHPFSDKNAKPCQLTAAELENGWSLQTVFWYTYYEALVERVGDAVDSYNVDIDESTEKMPSLLTRIDAQLKAEKLFEQLGEDIIRQCNY